MEPIIRKAEPQDAEGIISLMRAFAEYEDLGQYCTITEELLVKAMFGTDGFVRGLVAELDGVLAAYALYYPSFSSFRGERGLYLEDIFIDKEHRRRSLGELMLRQIAREAESEGLERIDFQVLDWNSPAVSFYKKHGAEVNDGESHFVFRAPALHRLAKAV